MRDQAGFTFVELLIATAIMMAVVGSIFALTTPAQGMYAAQPEEMEMQQRLRVGLDMLTRDLLMAGAGTYFGPLGGPLSRCFAPVLPYRIGSVSADSPGQYFTDRLTAIYVPPTAAQTRTGSPIASTLSAVTVVNDRGCPESDPACGFEKDMGVLVMDTAGSWDTFTVTGVQGSLLQLQHRGSQLSKTYDAGARISQVVTYTYWLKTDPTTDTFQLMRYDGYQSDVPVADNVVGLAFELFGDPSSGTGETGPVRLSQWELTDGPWLPDAAAANRFDADLLRVRKVGVTLRVQASVAFRAPAGPLFRRGGASRRSEHYLPDHEIRFDVSPRNLGR